MTKSYHQSRRDAAFLASEASGHRSREVVTLKRSATPYPSGAVLVAEVSTGAGAASTGLHILLNATAVAADAPAVVLINATDATDGPVEVAVIARDAEVKRGLIEAASGIAAADIEAALALNTIVVRDSF